MQLVCRACSSQSVPVGSNPPQEHCTCVVGGERLDGCKDDDCVATGGHELTVIDAFYMVPGLS